MSSRIILLVGLMILLAVSIAPVFGQTTPTATPAPTWDGQRRFTVLVLGMDRRPGARDTLNVRTDAILLVSLDPATQSIGILHLPRDLRMTTPYCSDYFKINTLLVEGESLQEGYGPYYAIDTFQYNLGMYIDGYIAFDFAAFVTIIDALGGVEIDVPYAIRDDLYPDMDYGYDPVFITPGLQRMDGYTALQYARTRHGDNDIDRGYRQMQVMLAIQQRITEANLLPSLLQQAPVLWTSLQSNLYTDLTLPTLLQLGQYAIATPAANIHIASVEEEYSLYYPIPDGTMVSVLNHARLPELLAEVFGADYSR